MFCPSQIENYIITGLVSNFFMHLVTGWHLLCRKEFTIRISTDNCHVIRYNVQAILNRIESKIVVHHTMLQVWDIEHTHTCKGIQINPFSIKGEKNLKYDQKIESESICCADTQISSFHDKRQKIIVNIISKIYANVSHSWIDNNTVCW